MAVPTAYLKKTDNTKSIFDSIQRASVPDFGHDFLQRQLGFTGARPAG